MAQDYHGKVAINGAKNSAVAILPATILIKGKCRIDNLPNISDVTLCYEILESLGAKITYISPNEIEIDCPFVPVCSDTRLFFGEKATFDAYNEDGAVVEIVIPCVK